MFKVNFANQITVEGWDFIKKIVVKLFFNEIGMEVNFETNFNMSIFYSRLDKCC